MRTGGWLEEIQGSLDEQLQYVAKQLGDSVEDILGPLKGREVLLALTDDSYHVGQSIAQGRG